MVGRVSEENVDSVRRALEHFAATDEILLDVMAAGFVWDMSTFEGWPDEPEFTGADGLRRFLTLWREPWHDWSMQLDEIHDCGDDRVLALLHQSGKPHGSDSTVYLDYGMVCTLEDGRIRRIQTYATLHEAREAAGLSA
jgi:ketosteroid isomerase-like protein